MKKVDDEMLVQIMGLIEKGDKQIELEDINSIIVNGDTGSGKSTLINYLAGEELIAFKPANSRALKIKTANSTPKAVIGHTQTSETLIPGKIKNDSGTLIYWDCPGFDDSRGAAVDISNSFCINKLFSSKNLKVLVVVDETALTGPKRGKTFKDLVFRLSELFEDKNELIKSMAIVFTKARDIDDYRQELKILVNQAGDEMTLPQKNLLREIIEKSQISYFDLPSAVGAIPTDQREDILSSITNAEYISCPNVKITLSATSLVAVQQLIEFMSKKLGKLSKKLTSNIEKNISANCELKTLKNIDSILQNIETSKDGDKACLISFMKDISNKVFEKNTNSPEYVASNNIFQEIESIFRYFDNFFLKIIPDSELNNAKLIGPFCINLWHKVQVSITQIEHKENEEKLSQVMDALEKEHKAYQEFLAKKEHEIELMLKVKEDQISIISQQLEQEKQHRVDMNQIIQKQEAIMLNLNQQILTTEEHNTHVMEEMNQKLLGLTNSMMEAQNQPDHVTIEHHHHHHSSHCAIS